MIPRFYFFFLSLLLYLVFSLTLHFYFLGVPWTEEEHRLFLIGLQKLGKGDWRGIARNYVVSRTPTQVASHAQKYFIRQSNVSRRKRRSSLFDIVADEVSLLISQRYVYLYTFSRPLMTLSYMQNMMYAYGTDGSSYPLFSWKKVIDLIIGR